MPNPWHSRAGLWPRSSTSPSSERAIVGMIVAVFAPSAAAVTLGSSAGISGLLRNKPGHHHGQTGRICHLSTGQASLPFTAKNHHNLLIFLQYRLFFL